jgi:hypothetical protein
MVRLLPPYQWQTTILVAQTNPSSSALGYWEWQAEHLAEAW